ncbi:MAG TPA: hypothetical protein VGE11_07785 [Pseudonocardia sp.]
MNTNAPAPQVLVIAVHLQQASAPFDPARMAEGIAAGTARFADAGVGVENCLLKLDGSEDVEAVVTKALESRPWRVVVIAGGVRRPENRLELFERVINLVHRHAPDAAIAFNSTPADTFEAASRWLA